MSRGVKQSEVNKTLSNFALPGAGALGGEPPFAAGANGSPKSGTSGHSLVLARLVALKSRGAISPGFFGFISILRREPVFISSGSVYS
mgnify:CR=1 FL=1